MASKKQSASAATAQNAVRKSKRYASYRHGTTLCRYCTAKIARGMLYCNNEHKRLFLEHK